MATHPSDMCVALAALGAVVTVEGSGGARDSALVDLHRLPGETPQIETALRPGELITAVTVPPNGLAARSSYHKVRDRALLRLRAGVGGRGARAGGWGDRGRARLALGGVAPSCPGAPGRRRRRSEAAPRRWRSSARRRKRSSLPLRGFPATPTRSNWPGG